MVYASKIVECAINYIPIDLTVSAKDYMNKEKLTDIINSTFLSVKENLIKDKNCIGKKTKKQIRELMNKDSFSESDIDIYENDIKKYIKKSILIY